MHIKRILCIVLLLHNVILFAQDTNFIPPDYAEVEKQTKDNSSPYYYPILMKRYEANDTTLTPKEMHMLYYGAFFNKEGGSEEFYSSSYQDSIKVIMNKDRLTDDDRRLLIKYYHADYERSPLNLRILNALYNLNKTLGRPEAESYGIKLRSIARTIIATGDGRTDKSGYHVICVPDEYKMIAIMGYRPTGSQALVNQCDYLTVEKNDDGIEGIYFDVSQMFEGYKTLFKDTDKKNSSEGLKRTK